MKNTVIVLYVVLITFSLFALGYLALLALLFFTWLGGVI